MYLLHTKSQSLQQYDAAEEGDTQGMVHAVGGGDGGRPADSCGAVQTPQLAALQHWNPEPVHHADQADAEPMQHHLKRGPGPCGDVVSHMHPATAPWGVAGQPSGLQERGGHSHHRHSVPAQGHHTCCTSGQWTSVLTM